MDPFSRRDKRHRWREPITSWQAPASRAASISPEAGSPDLTDPARAIIDFARQHQITQIVIGSIQRGGWHITDSGPILRHVIHEAGASGVDVHIIGRREKPPAEAPDQ